MIEAEPFPNRYDEVPYPNLSHALTHPDRMAVIATLLKMQPVPTDQCRVLELGCAGAWNLIAMAEQLPQSTFVGIDYSPLHVEEANTAIQSLGLSNVTTHHLDILDIDADFGQFDYIIAHGIYSWVPPHVREKVLAICRDNLSPQGVAYISYNTFPGWHTILMVRQMMLYHTRHFSDPHERVTEALKFADFLGETVAKTGNAVYGSFLEAYRNWPRSTHRSIFMNLLSKRPCMNCNIWPKSNFHRLCPPIFLERR